MSGVPRSMTTKIWANSGDSHYFEPPDLYAGRLPKALAERMPRSVKSEDGTSETIYVDGKSFEGQARPDRNVRLISEGGR